MMTQNQIKLIKQSWNVFRDIDPKLIGDLFYSKLFVDNPSLKKMFPKDMEQQYLKLIDMLNTIVGRLEKLEELTADIAAMAQRHVQYGVKPAHYKLVGTALMWTLEKGLGSSWNKELEVAWSSCYTILSDTMIGATKRQD